MMNDKDSDGDDNDDDNDDDNNMDHDNDIDEDVIGKGSNPRKIKKKGGVYNNDMSFVHGRDWAKKYNEFRDLCQEYKKDNILLRAELRAAKGTRETTKRKMRESLGWDGEEASLAENVGYYCREYLFPCYKFLKDKCWDVFDPDQQNNSLSNFVRKGIKIPEGADYCDTWDRVIVPSIRLKYMNMRCNINNDVRSAYKSEYLNLYIFLLTIANNYLIIVYIT